MTEDLLQQSLMKAVERGHELKKSDSAVSWFSRILRNAVTDYYRSHAADHRKMEGLRLAMIAAGEDTMPALDEYDLITSNISTAVTRYMTAITGPSMRPRRSAARP